MVHLVVEDNPLPKLVSLLISMVPSIGVPKPAGSRVVAFAGMCKARLQCRLNGEAAWPPKECVLGLQGCPNCASIA